LHTTIARGTGRQLLHSPPTRRERFVLAILLPIIRPIAVRVLGYGFRPERIDAAVLDAVPLS
ncbi:MAG TPA: hypothetical protein VGM38_05690, partial [Pseudolysinimonas sp.]